MTMPTQAAVRPVLLSVLAQLGGAARPREVYPLVTARFPELTEQDLVATLNDGRTNRWTNRIQWARQDLADAGIIDNSQRGVWALTTGGAGIAAGELTTEELAPASALQRQAEPVADMVSLIDQESGEEILELPRRSARIASELAAAAIDSRDPSRLERAVGVAFEFLGFEVEVIGGPNQTDVLLEAPLGTNRYRVVVDAKSTASGRVPDNMIDWLSIKRIENRTTRITRALSA